MNEDRYDGPERRAQQETPWHLDKSVPVSLIGALLLQAAMGLWFASKLDSRIGALEAWRVEQHERDQLQDKATAEALGLVRQDVAEVKQLLIRMLEERRK